MNIGDAAMRANLPVKTVRYYDEIGLVVPNGRSENGYRQYEQSEIERLVFVRRARSFGFSVEACRELLSLYQDETRSSRDVKQIVLDRIEQIDARLEELRHLRQDLSSLADACKGDDDPDCPIIEGLSVTHGS